MDNEKRKQINSVVNESLDWLIENDLWEDFRKIIMEGIIKLAEKLREERRVRLSSFGIKPEEHEIEEEWMKEIDEIIDLSNRKDDNEFV